MFQNSSGHIDVLEVLVLIVMSGVGILMLVITLTVLIAKLVIRNTLEEATENLIEEEDADDVEDECALFIIDERYNLDTEGLLNDKVSSMITEQIEESDRSAATNCKNQTTMGKFLKAVRERT